jgi:hypothetical protein
VEENEGTGLLSLMDGSVSERSSSSGSSASSDKKKKKKDKKKSKKKDKKSKKDKASGSRETDAERKIREKAEAKQATLDVKQAQLILKKIEAPLGVRTHDFQLFPTLVGGIAAQLSSVGGPAAHSVLPLKENTYAVNGRINVQSWFPLAAQPLIRFCRSKKTRTW